MVVTFSAGGLKHVIPSEIEDFYWTDIEKNNKKYEQLVVLYEKIPEKQSNNENGIPRS